MAASGWSTFANFVSSKEFLKNNSYGVGLCLEILLIKKIHRSSPSEVFLAKGILKIYSKFTGEHPCRSVISIKLQSNFIEIALRHGCSSVNLLHIFRTAFYKNSPEGLFLNI